MYFFSECKKIHVFLRICPHLLKKSLTNLFLPSVTIAILCRIRRTKRLKEKNVMRCAIWYHLYNLKNAKKTHGGVSLLVKLQVLACNFTKISTLPWVFFMFFKLYKWYQIAQRITNMDGFINQKNKKKRKRKL